MPDTKAQPLTGANVRTETPPARAHTLTMEGRARLCVTGVARIVSCDENGATLQTPQGDLTIGGQGMQVSELSVRTGEVRLSGQIEYLQYTENRQTRQQAGGLLARLLR